MFILAAIFKDPTLHEHPKTVICKIAKSIRSLLYQLHLAMEALRKKIITYDQQLRISDTKTMSSNGEKLTATASGDALNYTITVS